MLVNKKLKNLKKIFELKKKNQGLLEKINKNFLETAYYIRDLFNKYRIKIIIYQSKMNEKNYSEIDLGFNADALTFFKLIKDIEEGEKIIVIKNMRITKLKVPNFKVEMKLGGYYNE